MAKPRSTTTKSILDNYSGDVLDIPNGKDKILDHYKNPNVRGKFNVKLFGKISHLSI